ncbi:hypothetical protein C8A05DRAFT_36990 [Staphylotrichum tortipilum]|uniref:Uncharacterized protein n=1 Tax=Staphylotrichum tortipilum TaxID=2831512 RepID=A0AAN6MFY6_9PEZI|nr:hypothetical protein C8A05DRAFT_36990 [Staphylotrichum longicolle]
MASLATVAELNHSKKIAHGLAPDPSLIITPPNVVTQFAQAAIEYLEKEIQLPGSDARMSADTTHLAREVQGDILSNFVRGPPGYQAPKKDKLLALVLGSLSKMRYAPNQTSRLFRKHRLLVFSSNPQALSPKGRVHRFFGRRYELHQQQRERLKEYFAPWAVAPRFIALDESHSASRKGCFV